MCVSETLINRLEQALSLSDEARVITSAISPFKIVHTNKAWSELTGYAFTEVVGKSCDFLNGPHTEQKTLERLGDCIRAKKTVTVQVIYYKKSGQPLSVRLSCSPVLRSDGTVTNMLGVLRSDPSHPSLIGVPWRRHLTQLAAPPPPHSFDRPPNQPAGSCTAAGHATHAMGAPARVEAGLYGRALEDQPVTHSASIPIAAANASHSKASACSSDVFSIAPSLPPSTAPAAAGLGGMRRSKRARDLTKLDSVLGDETQGAVVITAKDPPYNIIHANKAWCELCGYEAEEVEGKTNKILTGPETDPAQLNELMRAVRRCEPTVHTLVNYKKGGKRFVNQVHVSPLYDENKDVVAFMAHLTEVA
uniref:PAS domain-containing protein n=2 Tax=Chrysotila carterae TaxID=13221 RepID=A0A7S4BVW4_CHRCT